MKQNLRAVSDPREAAVICTKGRDGKPRYLALATGDPPITVDDVVALSPCRRIVLLSGSRFLPVIGWLTAETDEVHEDPAVAPDAIVLVAGNEGAGFLTMEVGDFDMVDLRDLDSIQEGLN